MSVVAPPIPLVDPAGNVLAYACPRCRHVCAHTTGGTPETRLEFSMREADQCCRCFKCGVPRDRFGMYCPACKKDEDARIAAVYEEMRPAEEAFKRLREERLTTALDRDAAVMLERLMSDISEEHYCAGWNSGLDVALWNIVQGGPRRYGMDEVSPENVAELRRLHEKSGGWWAEEPDGVLFTTDWPGAKSGGEHVL